MIAASEAALNVLHSLAMHRTISIALFAIALGCFAGAALLLINGFVDFLQNGRWNSTSLLQISYDLSLIRARWFLANQWSWWLHDLLALIPTYLALLIAAPLCWWLSGRFAGR